jgi:beta-glucanase (GH16 family)
MSGAARLTIAIVLVGVALYIDIGRHAPHRTIRISMEGGSFIPAPPPPGPLAAAPPRPPTPGVTIGAEIGAIVKAAAAPTQIASRTPTPPRAPSVGLPAGFIDRFRALNEQGLWAVSDGWSNGPWVANDWRRQQITVTQDGLAITMAANPPGAEKAFASGEISTHESYRYGYFETRFRMPRGSGLVVGAFTFTRQGGARSWNEIDMELLGRDTRTLELTHHVGGRPTKHVVHLPFDAAEGFHTYAFDWRPDVIRWYVDNELVLESRGANVEHMNLPQRFIVNLWNSELLHAWVGPIESRQAPWTLVVSCVAHADAYEGRSLCAPS